MKRVTISDIAEHLGISKYSVSRALAGKSGVSEATRARVIAAAKELGYQPGSRDGQANPVRSHNLVLIIRRDEVHDHEFWMEVISGCEEEARRAGYDLVTRPLAREEMEQKPVLDHVAGLIVAGSRARPAMDHYLAAGIPAVLITYPHPLEKIDSVTIADWEGGYAMAHHLIELGHRRLAFVTDTPEKPSHAWRYAGFRARIERQDDARVIQLYIDADAPGASFERQFMKLAGSDQRPTAVFCATDGLALTVMWALNRNGLTVPDDVSVAGCNDILEAQRSTPKLTTLQIPKRALGSQAVSLLIDMIEGRRRPGVPRRISLMPSLILRESTAAPRPVRRISREPMVVRPNG